MDSKGVTGFPMRLVVTAVILSLCIPVLAEMADGFREQASETEALRQISIIEDISSSLFYHGPGSSRVVEIDIPAGYELWIGGEGAYAYSVSLMYGDTPVKKVFMEHPSIPFSEETVKLSGHLTLRLECQKSDDGCCIGVTEL